MGLFNKKKKKGEQKAASALTGAGSAEIIASAVLVAFACLTGLILNLADRKKARK